MTNYRHSVARVNDTRIHQKIDALLHQETIKTNY